MAPKTDHMEYSKWHEIVTTWSTPWGLFFMPNGVLHMANLESIFYPLGSETFRSFNSSEDDLNIVCVASFIITKIMAKF